jgi:TPR repeat protein
MPSPAEWERLRAQLSGMGFDRAAAEAQSYAKPSADEWLADARLKSQRQALSALNENVTARREQVRRGVGLLPAGFTPIRDEKDLGRQGMWPYLKKDHNPALVPPIRRNGQTHTDTKRLVELYERAWHGNADAQREMGRILEIGALGVEVDLDRAFFWYFRAGLQNEPGAREDALRLKRTVDIDPATMQEPVLIYAGKWEFLIDNFGQGFIRLVITLRADGTFSEPVIKEVGGAAFTLLADMLGAQRAQEEIIAAALQNMSIEGRWSFDQKRLFLNWAQSTSAPSAPDQSESLQIEILGVGDADGQINLFGRDQKLVAYTLRAITFEI